MRKFLFALMLVVLAGAVIAGTISQAFTQKQIRDPRKLETILEDNFAEIDNRTDGSTAMDILTDDIGMSGNAADTLSMNVNTANQTTNTVQVNAYFTDTTYLDIVVRGTNDSGETIVWGRVRFQCDDATTNTEDSTVIIMGEVNGTETSYADLSTAGAEFGTLQVLCTGADLGEGALANGGAIAADSYDADTAAALPVGGATATRVDMGASDAVTKILGGLNLKYANKTANYTNTVDDCVLSFNTSAGTTNTLPEASTVLGAVFVIALQDDDGDLVVMTDGTDKFDGTNDILTFADAGDSCVVMATAADVYTIIVNVGGTLSN